MKELLSILNKSGISRSSERIILKGLQYELHDIIWLEDDRKSHASTQDAIKECNGNLKLFNTELDILNHRVGTDPMDVNINDVVSNINKLKDQATKEAIVQQLIKFIETKKFLCRIAIDNTDHQPSIQEFERSIKGSENDESVISDKIMSPMNIHNTNKK